MVGKVAIQQALVIEFGVCYSRASEILGVHPRTIWQHCAARKGSGVRPWAKRSQEERRAAYDAALALIREAWRPAWLLKNRRTDWKARRALRPERD